MEVGEIGHLGPKEIQTPVPFQKHNHAENENMTFEF